MSGARSRRKGVLGERELAALLNGATIERRTLTARRVPNVGAMAGGSWGGDVLVGERCQGARCQLEDGTCACGGTGVEPGSEERWEVKRYASATGRGFGTIVRWLADSFALAFRENQGEWLVVMRLKDLIEVAQKPEAPASEAA